MGRIRFAVPLLLAAATFGGIPAAAAPIANASVHRCVGVGYVMDNQESYLEACSAIGRTIDPAALGSTQIDHSSVCITRYTEDYSIIRSCAPIVPGSVDVDPALSRGTADFATILDGSALTVHLVVNKNSEAELVQYARHNIYPADDHFSAGSLVAGQAYGKVAPGSYVTGSSSTATNFYYGTIGQGLSMDADIDWTVNP